MHDTNAHRFGHGYPNGQPEQEVTTPDLTNTEKRNNTMTTATKNTLTLADICGGKGATVLDVPLLADHQGFGLSGGRMRPYSAVNSIMDADTGLPFFFPSCSKARETVEWEAEYESMLVRFETLTVDGAAVDEVYLATVALNVKGLEGVAKEARSASEFFEQFFVSTLVKLWALTDAYSFIKTGCFVDSETGRGMSLMPISPDIYGVGGRVFASDLWDFMARMYATGSAANRGTAKGKPAKKNDKRKAASKARKASKKK
jgi:hypothetical protein